MQGKISPWKFHCAIVKQAVTPSIHTFLHGGLYQKESLVWFRLLDSAIPSMLAPHWVTLWTSCCCPLSQRLCNRWSTGQMPTTPTPVFQQMTDGVGVSMCQHKNPSSGTEWLAGLISLQSWWGVRTTQPVLWHVSKNKRTKSQTKAKKKWPLLDRGVSNT